MDIMKKYPDKHFDLAIVDPPYGIGWHKENNSMSAGIKKDGTKRVQKSWNKPIEKGYKLKDWDNAIPNKLYFSELFRISKNQIIWGGNYFTDNLYPHGGWIIWDKGVPDGMSLSQCELAWNSCLNSTRIIKILWAGYKKSENENRIHPTQKPVALYRWLLDNYAKPNDLILDTHAGSFSSAVACKEKGFSGVFIELDPDYFRDGKKRVDKASRQYDLIKPDKSEPEQLSL